MNFSLSKAWCYALTLRYPVDKIKQYGKLFFYEKDNILVCQHFFEFDTRNASDCLAFNKWIQFNKKESLLSFSKDLMIL